MNVKSISFVKNADSDFLKTLNSRVNNYFKEKKIKRTGNWKLYWKAIIMFSLLLVPVILIFTISLPKWVALLFVIIAGTGLAGVGMNVMHDGNHGAFSSRKWVNKLMGSSIYILAGNVYNWKVQHNILHHTFTNIKGLDQDLDTGDILRFSRHHKWYSRHKFQKFYSLFLYGLLTISWAIASDFRQSNDYLKRKLSYGKFPNPTKQWVTLIISKILYFGTWVVLPIFILDFLWWEVVLGFIIMHYTAGVILSFIFQLAHVVPKTEMPMPDENGLIKHVWAVHQLYTTTNFAPKNKFISWYSGGLNHQVEHHIFPHISHIHYSKIAEIVKKTVKEFNLPYNEYRTTRGAILAHFKHLDTVGAHA